MLKPGGTYIVIDPSTGQREGDTFTCFHCQSVVFVRPGHHVDQDLGGFCRICMKMICGPCADRGTCTPWERELEASENRARFRRIIEKGYD